MEFKKPAVDKMSCDSDRSRSIATARLLASQYQYQHTLSKMRSARKPSDRITWNGLACVSARVLRVVARSQKLSWSGLNLSLADAAHPCEGFQMFCGRRPAKTRHAEHHRHQVDNHLSRRAEHRLHADFRDVVILYALRANAFFMSDIDNL